MNQSKKPVKPIDLKKALVEKQASEFSESIKTGTLYNELKPEKKN